MHTEQSNIAIIFTNEKGEQDVVTIGEGQTCKVLIGDDQVRVMINTETAAKLRNSLNSIKLTGERYTMTERLDMEAANQSVEYLMDLKNLELRYELLVKDLRVREEERMMLVRELRDLQEKTKQQ